MSYPNIAATVIPCPACKAALVIVNGQPQGDVTMFMRAGKPAITKHTEDCEYRGRATPYPPAPAWPS